ncbi:hypothetical protein [Blastopirellula marina]|uniref:Uncharacterized protein n=1 Tax=Blastopirellula marina DSM 3645 TaxID=314230 RepID=A3ZPI9_9BACT|nr:hypothetical protein [Blastopirellula marina]EAQ81667.1 hypothetical protein DSM3645_28837 [Blastopirellula marina DSM 3645]
MASTFETIWDAVYADIVGLGLSGLVSDQIKQQQFAYNPASELFVEGIFLCPANELLPDAGSNQRMLTSYGVSVTLIKASNGVLGKGVLSPVLQWRETIRLRYHDRRPITVAGVHRFWCEPGGMVLPEAFEKQFDASAFVIRADTYEG